MDWPLTFKCNNNCISCIFDTRMNKYMGTPYLKEIKRVIEKVPEGEYLAFTGGEPTLREEFFDILKMARQRHPKKYLFVVSNGRAFSDKKFVKKLKELNLGNFMIGIALYGHNAEIHDSITRVKGSWNETMKGIENLLNAGFNVELRVIVLTEIAEIVKKKFFKIKRIVFINMKYTGNAFINRKKIFVKYSKAAIEAQKAFDALEGTKIETRLYHFPLCLLEEKYRKAASGITKQSRELTLLEKCNECSLKEECPQIWKTYLPLAGESEFKPVK